MKYTVSGHVMISVATIVEAKSKAEARRIAETRGVMGLCHHCASGDSADSEFVTGDGLDGEVTITSVDKS